MRSRLGSCVPAVFPGVFGAIPRACRGRFGGSRDAPMHGRRTMQPRLRRSVTRSRVCVRVGVCARKRTHARTRAHTRHSVRSRPHTPARAERWPLGVSASLEHGELRQSGCRVLAVRRLR